jgi:serine/threonine-protein kinase
MAAGLAHVHGRGFLHFDFKPKNILLSADMEPKIADFDLCIPRPAYPVPIKHLSGTFSYLAPEQVLGHPVDERADIFAFGLTAYEMLTHRKPFTADTSIELTRKYANPNINPEPPSYFAPDVPAEIERIVLKCLEKDVDCRYHSMEMVLHDLEQT